ncbi:MAG TPA: sodium-translocating pyrophosphatase [Longimicrobiaceae bacterium]|nr:sodium-translocating pyrophosphatase [Longimicrobiaceae bacterium]
MTTPAAPAGTGAVAAPPPPPPGGRAPALGGPTLLVAIAAVVVAAGLAALLMSGVGGTERNTLLFVFVTAAVALAAALWLAGGVLRQDRGNEAMQHIAGAIQEGAEAFMRRQYRTIALLALATGALVFVLYAVLRESAPSDPADRTQMAIYTAAAFLFGATCSGIAGIAGMWVAIRSNIRVAAAARTSIGGALRTALRGGAVAGFFVVALSLAGVAALFAVLRLLGTEPGKAPLLIVGYGFGASFVALFAQLGGGIYTKAADVGADLVGKVEAGIPEDDPRNPAVIADLVGDNVGDCAGRGADLFESIAAENIGAMVLGIALVSVLGVQGILFPLAAAAAGLLASIVGVVVVRMKEDEDPMAALNRGFYVTVALALVGLFATCRLLLDPAGSEDAWLRFFGCAVIGILTSVAFVFITQYYTEYRYRPVKSIAQQSLTGPATNIIAGLAVGLESTALPVIMIGTAILSSYWLGSTTGIEAAGLLAEGSAATGIDHAGLFGTAVATIGMLSTAGYILAMDNFGPITDNAGGIVEMSHQPDEVRNRTDKLDSAGNTTKALTKGYALGSAGLAAFLLFSAFLDTAREYGAEFVGVNLANPAVFVGGFLGAMLVFLFSATAIRAVGNAAGYVIEEVRRQFRERPGILQNTERPDYAQCVNIVTGGALRQMVLPGVLAVGMPIAAGVVFKLLGAGAEALAAFLMVGTIAGILMASLLNNGGGAWDNAKKYIEMGEHGGKGSDAHKAAVIGDTVGDPFKDTAGPSLHVLIKLLATVMLVLAPFFA